MSKATIDDREIEAAFLARAAGSPSPELQQRISVTVQATRQRRPILAWPWPLLPGSARLAWVAIMAATAIALLGLLAVVGGWQPRLLATLPTPQPSGSPMPSPSATGSPGPASPAPGTTPAATSRSLQVRFLNEGKPVTIDITDRSGRLVEAVKGEEGLDMGTGTGPVWLANPPGELTTLRVEWFSPAGCHDQYGMTIDTALRTITMHTSYVEGGDSIGGNCGVTLRFASEAPAGTIEGVLDNVPPIFGAGSLGLNQPARVIATGGLRVRSMPGTGADSQRLEPLLPAGVRLLVLEGPVTADGYAWYRTAPCGGQPTYPAGWIAAASRLGEQWVERALSLDCPAP